MTMFLPNGIKICVDHRHRFFCSRPQTAKLQSAVGNELIHVPTGTHGYSCVTVKFLPCEVSLNDSPYGVVPMFQNVAPGHMQSFIVMLCV